EHERCNGAKVPGLQDKAGRARPGPTADLLVVNGNPLQNLHLLNPYGTDLMTIDGKVVDNYSGDIMPGDPRAGTVHGGGIEWTIKDGVPYHVPTLMREVKDMVTKARDQRTTTASKR